MDHEQPTPASPDPDLERIRKTFPEARRDASGMMVLDGNKDSPQSRRLMAIIRQNRCIGGSQYVKWE